MTGAVEGRGATSFVELVHGSNEPLHVDTWVGESSQDQETEQETEEPDDEDTMSLDDGMDEDAASLIGVSISRAATYVTSARTPAAERAAAVDYLRGGGYFHVDGDITPDAELMQEPDLSPREVPASRNTRKPKLQLNDLPRRKTEAKPEEDALPSSWRAGQRQFTERSSSSRSALKDALETPKRRSSWGNTDFRKYLPSMPSLPIVGHFASSLPFSSHNASQKQRNRGSSTTSNGKPSSQTSRRTSPTGTSARTHSSSTSTLLDGQNAQLDGPRDSQPLKPKMLRRVTSDQSILYHTLSRSSSLGDDSRWDDHHEMVNSRVKAIRDSLQDRSSFRLPSLPNMPSMPSSPTFRRAMDLFSFNSTNVSSSWSVDTDESKGIIPGISKKKCNAGTLGAETAAPEAAKPTNDSTTDSTHSDALESAMLNLTGDVVIMGGYRGSILRSAKPPHRQLWVPVKVGLNIRKVDLEVGLDPEDEERMEETIFASGMLSHIGPVDISRRLFKRLRDSENARNGTLRVWDYGWDWRLSPALSSRRLQSFLEGLPCNNPAQRENGSGALVIAHSLGGLITRHVVNKRPELFSGVIYAGTPQACVNILGPIRNGDAVLISQRVLTAQVNFTLRTSFALLPLEGYCFEDKYTREKYTVDYFNVDDWIKYRFSPCTDPPLPPKNPPPQTGITSLFRNSSISTLPLPGRKKDSISPPSPVPSQQGRGSRAASPPLPTESERQHLEKGDRKSPGPRSLPARAVEAVEEAATTDRSIAPQMGNMSNPVQKGQSTKDSISTLVTIPRPKAIEYLRRTLAETKQFKLELAHRAEFTHDNLYPPFAVIYGKSIPTVNAARVDGRDGIACADCYDDLGFGSGDGVCLAKEAMLPTGYKCVQGGRVSSDRGHVTLLGDLGAVGKAIEAVLRGRQKGLGLGPDKAKRRILHSHHGHPDHHIHHTHHGRIGHLGHHASPEHSDPLESPSFEANEKTAGLGQREKVLST